MSTSFKMFSQEMNNSKNNKNIRILMLIKLLLLVLSCTFHQVRGDQIPMIKAGYFPEYRSYIDLNRTVMELTDLILFSIEPSRNMNFEDGCCLNENIYKQAREARAYKQEEEEISNEWNRDKTTASETCLASHDDEKENKSNYSPSSSPLRILVSVGGAGRSSAFPQLISTQEKRSQFIKNLESLCVKEELNGVDYDWEQPQTMEHYQLYMRLIQETYIHFNHPKKTQKLLVTVALHPHQMLPAQLYDYVDRIHLMTYDMISETHHASYDRVVSTVEKFIHQGKCPSNKIVVGIPLYARHAKNPHQVKTISEIMDDFLTKSENNNPKITNGDNLDTHNGYYFESPSLLKQKLQYINQKQLGGIFFWEIGQDFRHDTHAPGGYIMSVKA